MDIFVRHSKSRKEKQEISLRLEFRLQKLKGRGRQREGWDNNIVTVLEKQRVRVWIGLRWPRIGCVISCFCKHFDELPSFREAGIFLASQATANF